MSDTRFWVSSTPSVIGPISVTPEVAAEMLESNGANRNKRDGNIDRYARDMASGHWRLIGQSIQFSKSGRLLDGQNRLMACVRSGAPFETFVCVGLDDDAMRSIDKGSPRTFSDDLKIAGYDNATRVAAATSNVFRYQMTGDARAMAGRGRSSKASKIGMTSDEGFETLRAHPGIIDTVKALRRREKLSKIANMSTIDAFAYVVGRVHREDAEYFFDRLTNPMDLSEGSPILALISTSSRLNDKARAARVGSGHSAEMKLAIMIKAWNAFMDGSRVARLGWRSGGANAEDFPHLPDEYKL